MLWWKDIEGPILSIGVHDPKVQVAEFCQIGVGHQGQERSMIMILFKSSIDIIAIKKMIGQGLESEQCVELGPGKVSTLSFRTELHKLPPDFWSKVSQRGQTQSSRSDGMSP